MFVRFSCGCVGINGLEEQINEIGEGNERVVVMCCDTDAHDTKYLLGTRVINKPNEWEALSDSEAWKVFLALSWLVSDGYRMRTITSLISEGLVDVHARKEE